jgi:glyoxylase-like metal-dependent hydrolase (beta-lactamase superfamily II)
MVDWPQSERLPAFRMLVRPYERPVGGVDAFYWLVRVTAERREVMVDRGAGPAARARIERRLRQLVGGVGETADMAALALFTGWVRRP